MSSVHSDDWKVEEKLHIMVKGLKNLFIYWAIVLNFLQKY